MFFTDRFVKAVVVLLSYPPNNNKNCIKLVKLVARELVPEFL